MKYIDLFAGIGGFRLGIEKGWEHLQRQSRNREILRPNGDSTNSKTTRSKSQPVCDESENICVYTNEWDKYAADIYDKRFNTTIDRRDLTTVDADSIPDHDLLCGGFPCQAFSVAGKRRGFEDTRGTLFFDIARILKAKRPTYLLLENVKGLLSHDNNRTFQTILWSLDELGYDLQWQVLNSKNFGVPQNRERVFIIGHLRGERRPKVFPVRSLYETNTRPEQVEENSYSEFTVDSSNTGGVNVAGSIRRLTPIECERLQGFPDNWTQGLSDTQRYKTLGNAVSVPVVEYIISKMFELFRRNLEKRVPN